MTITAEQLRQEVNKALGSDVLHSGSDDRFKVSYIPTGLLPVDILLQGGLPRGRFTTIQGDWSTLKTYVGLNAAREVQAAGGVAAVIDTEHAFDPEWARSIGINIDDLIIEHPETGELAMDTAEALIRGGVDLIVFDSVAATLPQAEQEKRFHKENIQPGRQAALMSAACRRLTASNSKTAVLWINQFRENVGMSFGPREKATGGRALPYYSSYIVEIRKVGKITRDEQMYTGEKWQGTKVQVGQKFKMELIKSKLNKPFREMWFDWSLTDGDIDMTAFLVTQGIELGLIDKKGNTWSHASVKAVGRDKFKAALQASPAAQASLTEGILTHHGVASKTTKTAPKKAAVKPPVKRLKGK